MVTHSYYESDNRVLRYAEALAEHGYDVEVVALRRSPSTPKCERMNNVLVHRIQDRFEKNAGSRWSYLWRLVRFLTITWWWFAARGRSRHFDLVHVHNIPDFLIFSAWLPKLRGAKLILDIHDIVPEFFASKFGATPQSILVKSLRVVERLSAALSDHVILANHLWLETYSSRSAPREKCSVFINYVDDRLFKRRTNPADRSGGPLILFPGGLQWHQGLDIAIRGFSILAQEIPDASFHIYGDGDTKSELMSLVDELSLQDSVQFFEPLSLVEIADVMATASLGVVPKRANSFGNEAYSTKIMEFMSLGVPVVVADTRVDQYYFDDSVVRFFASGNVDSLAVAMHDVLTNSSLRDSLVQSAAEYVARNCWNQHKSRYIQLVDSLIDPQALPGKGTDRER